MQSVLDTLVRRRQSPGMMPRDQTPLIVVKLSDHGGQYVLMLKCENYGHRREAHPEVFARLAGWEIALETIVDRLRWSQFGANRCMATARRPMKRDR
jgi:hypothetical protein